MIALICACNKDRCIGKNGHMAWSIPGEQKQFKELTTGHTVIMGRITYEDIGHPLPNRQNIVVSSTKNFTGANLITVSSLSEAIAAAESDEIYIGGGERLFLESLPYADLLYLTEVDREVSDGDAFFPFFDETKFTLIDVDCTHVKEGYIRRTYRRNHSANQ